LRDAPSESWEQVLADALVVVDFQRLQTIADKRKGVEQIWS
jgi:hypothetical protein